MKPYGKNDKEKNYHYRYQGIYWCNCWLCIPVNKGTKKSERHKAKLEVKKYVNKLVKS